MRTYRRLAMSLLFVMISVFLAFPAAAEEALDITQSCKIRVSEGRTDKLLDKKIASAWSPAGESAEIVVKVPESGAGYARLEWMFDPTGYVFLQYDDSQELITTRDESDSHQGISQIFELEPNACYFVLRLTSPGQEICSLRVFSKGELPPAVPQWEAPYEKCDLMVVSTHQDDEFIFMGGIIPYYERVMGKKVQVVYMANCGRLRRAEALNGLWEAGTRHYPEFINLADKRVASMTEGVNLWGGTEAVLGELVERIRRYRPEVILTHDLNGEYGHNQHKITAHAMRYAIEAAADPQQYPQSYAQYGAWQVKKLYLHLYPENVIDFDWNISCAELDGLTPLQVAKNAYAKHESQQKYYQVEDGGKYDNSLFGLAYTVVGDDLHHEDLFENIAQESPLQEAAAEARIVPLMGGAPEGEAPETVEKEQGLPAASAQTEAAIAPLETGAPSQTPVPNRSSKSAYWILLWIFAGCLIALSAAIVIGWALQRRRRRLRHRRRR